MEQEYRISTWNKIFYGFIALIMFVLSLFLFILQKPNKLFLIFPLTFLLISILIVVNFIKRKLIIDKKTIVCINLFSTKELNFSSVKGYRLGDKIIKIEPKSENDDILSIGNYKKFENSEAISEWIKNNFIDLDAQDLETEKQKFLKDTSFGFSENERLEKLESTKKIATAYNAISGFLAFILIFITNNISYIILLILPIIGIILVSRFDLIKFISNPKKSIYAHTIIGIGLPSFFSILKTSEFKIFKFDAIWLPIGIVICFIFSVLYYKGLNKPIGSQIGQMIAMLIVSILYGFGGVKIINCVFDKSKETIYNTTVIDQHISRGKHTSYHLKLDTWGPQNKIEDEEVSKKLYDKTKIGDTVSIKYKKGFLKSPWFLITPLVRAQ